MFAIKCWSIKRKNKTKKKKPLCSRLHHMWVKFVVGSLPSSVRFFSLYYSCFLSIKTGTSKFPFDLGRTESTRFNELLRTPKWSVSKQFTNYNNNSNTHYIHYWHFNTSLIINLNSQHRLHSLHSQHLLHLVNFLHSLHSLYSIHSPSQIPHSVKILPHRSPYNMTFTAVNYCSQLGFPPDIWTV